MTSTSPSVQTARTGCCPQVHTFEAEIKTLPNFDITQHDKLEDYALALKRTDTLYRSASALPRVGARDHPVALLGQGRP